MDFFNPFFTDVPTTIVYYPIIFGNLSNDRIVFPVSGILKINKTIGLLWFVGYSKTVEVANLIKQVIIDRFFRISKNGLLFIFFYTGFKVVVFKGKETNVFFI